jgi:hypothetical protein
MQLWEVTQKNFQTGDNQVIICFSPSRSKIETWLFCYRRCNCGHRQNGNVGLEKRNLNMVHHPKGSIFSVNRQLNMSSIILRMLQCINLQQYYLQ